MGLSIAIVAPIFFLVICVLALALGLLLAARLLRPRHLNRLGQTSYESGMDPIHDTHRRFDVRFYLLAIAFLVFDVELLFLYPWAVGFETRRLGDLETRRQAVSTSAANSDLKISQSPSLPVSQSFSLPVSRSTSLLFPGMMIFFALLALGFIYDWRKGVFQWN